MLGIDGVDFALDTRGVKKRFGEKARKAVERAEKGVWCDFETELRRVSQVTLASLRTHVGVAYSSIRPRVSAVGGKITLVVIFLRVFLGAEEEKVFTRSLS